MNNQPTYKQLVERQMREYPQSIIMTIEQVMEWANEDATHKRHRSICTAMYYEQVVWYTLDAYTHDGKPRPWGFRYGLEGSNYVSGYAGS